MYDSINVANRMLERATGLNETLTSVQVLKLVYLSHGWTLGLLDRPLIRDDVQAWEYGPVIPRLYNSMRRFKSNPVVGPLRGYGQRETMPYAEASIVDQVYDKYGYYSGPSLSRLTHMPGSPWETTYRPGSFGIVIPNDIIKDYYNRIASDYQESLN